MHQNLEELQKIDIEQEEDPALREIATAALKLSQTRQKIREQRFNITRALGLLDAADLEVDRILDLNILSRQLRLAELAVQ